jgi:curved DNA-binding protein CbpA
MEGNNEMRKRCLDTLELPVDATMLEVKTAYQHLKDLYTKGSIAISPLEDEYPENAKEDIIKRLDEAYAWLSANYQKAGDADAKGLHGKPSSSSSKAQQEVSTIEEFDGPTLRRVRQMLGIELGEVEFSTKISLQHIKNIEEEKFRALPEEVFVKGYIASYAKCLGLDTQKVVEQYIRRYRSGRPPAS